MEFGPSLSNENLNGSKDESVLEDMHFKHATKAKGPQSGVDELFLGLISAASLRSFLKTEL